VPVDEPTAAAEMREALRTGSAQPVADGVFDFTPDGEPRLLGSVCDACGAVCFPATRRCPSCFANRTRQALLPEAGVLDSFTIVRQGPPGWRGAVPYVIARVVLRDGPAVLSQLVDADTIRSGMALRLDLRRLYCDEQGREVIAPVFVPA